MASNVGTVNVNLDEPTYLAPDASESLAAHVARESECAQFMRTLKLDQLCRTGGNINLAPSEDIPPSQWAINLFAGKLLLSLAVELELLRQRVAELERWKAYREEQDMGDDA